MCVSVLQLNVRTTLCGVDPLVLQGSLWEQAQPFSSRQLSIVLRNMSSEDECEVDPSGNVHLNAPSAS